MAFSGGLAMFAIATLKHCFPDRKTVSILPGGHIIKKNPDSSPAHKSGRGTTGTASQKYEKNSLRQNLFRQFILDGPYETLL